MQPWKRRLLHIGIQLLTSVCWIFFILFVSAYWVPAFESEFVQKIISQRCLKNVDGVHVFLKYSVVD